MDSLKHWWHLCEMVESSSTSTHHFFLFPKLYLTSNQRDKKCCMVTFQEKRQERLSFLIISQSPRCLGPTYAQLLRVKAEKEPRGPFPVLGNIIKERHSGIMPYSEHGTNTAKSLESTRDKPQPILLPPFSSVLSTWLGISTSNTVLKEKTRFK